MQPDCQLRIPHGRGGRSRIVDGFVQGPPELIIEVARSTRSYDLGAKKADYERAGVLEYLFLGLDPGEVLWFHQSEGRFVPVGPDDDGILRSGVFAGLWLDPTAFLAGDWARLIAVLDRGLATPEHAAFVARLARAVRP